MHIGTNILMPGQVDDSIFLTLFLLEFIRIIEQFSTKSRNDKKFGVGPLRW